MENQIEKLANKNESSDRSDLENRIRVLQEKRLEIFSRLDKKSRFEFNDDMVRFINGIKEKLGSDMCNKYAMFHIWIGNSILDSHSGLPIENFSSETIDFPEEEFSIEKKVDELLEKYKN